MSNIKSIHQKIFSLEELLKQNNTWKTLGNDIVFTNGCFDLVHKGHIEMLAAAADLGQKLIVGINSDSSIIKLKKDGRPIIDEKSRSVLLASFSFIDAVILFSEKTPINLINRLLPDFLVKGGDYKEEEIVGSDTVKKNGGETIVIPFIEGFSSSKIIHKIKTTNG